MTSPITDLPRAVEIGFGSLGVPAPMVRVLETQGITSAFPIQIATLPDTMAGRDVIARGRTGSGKTLAFALPTITALARTAGQRRPRQPRGLVLVPTRELAEQVAEVFGPLAEASGLRVTTVYGGVSQARQVRALDRGVDIVVACPGRLEDLVGQRICRLDQVEVTILDEADMMADLGFLPAVRRLLDLVPKQGQRLLFSATIDNAIDAIVKRYLTNPVVHALDPVDEPESQMEHHVLNVAAGDKAAVVQALAGGLRRTLLFTRTKHAAKKLTAQLEARGIRAVELHGNLSQAARTRNLGAFSSGEATVLVATDIAARGIHVDDVALVVHVDPPAEHKAYLHRSGRTARAGAEGIVVTVATPDQRREVAALTRAAGIAPHATSVTHDHPMITTLVGPAAPPAPPRVRVAPEPSRPAARTTPRTDRPAAPARAGQHRRGRTSRNPRTSRTAR